MRLRSGSSQLPVMLLPETPVASVATDAITICYRCVVLVNWCDELNEYFLWPVRLCHHFNIGYMNVVCIFCEDKLEVYSINKTERGQLD